MSLLSVAPKSLTGMLTIPKLIEPLQIALAMLVLLPPTAALVCVWHVRAPSDHVRVARGIFHTGSSLSTGLSTQPVDK
jgi:hypothetical protein